MTSVSNKIPFLWGGISFQQISDLERSLKYIKIFFFFFFFFFWVLNTFEIRILYNIYHVSIKFINYSFIFKLLSLLLDRWPSGSSNTKNSNKDSCTISSNNIFLFPKHKFAFHILSREREILGERTLTSKFLFLKIRKYYLMKLKIYPYLNF